MDGADAGGSGARPLCPATSFHTGAVSATAQAEGSLIWHKAASSKYLGRPEFPWAKPAPLCPPPRWKGRCPWKSSTSSGMSVRTLLMAGFVARSLCPIPMLGALGDLISPLSNTFTVSILWMGNEGLEKLSDDRARSCQSRDQDSLTPESTAFSRHHSANPGHLGKVPNLGFCHQTVGSPGAGTRPASC